jgi:hypothetical protein
MNEYRKNLNDAYKEIVNEGFTWDIIGQIGKDGKAAGIIVYYDEQANMYQLIQGGYKNKGIIFTESQFKDMGFVIKGK